MSDRALEDFLILRELDEPITEAELEATGEQSGEALEELRDDGVGIRWVESEVLLNEAGKITGTFCHYQAESEDAIHKHADLCGLPTTRIDRRGQPLEGE